MSAPEPGRTLRTFLSRLRAGAALALAVVALPASAPAGNVTVQRFSPQGLVKGVQQVTASFSAPMVPFGDLRDVAPPFTVKCPAKGQGRWIDSTTWSYDFEKPLASGLRCSFRLRDNLRSEDGSTVIGSTVVGSAAVGSTVSGNAIAGSAATGKTTISNTAGGDRTFEIRTGGPAVTVTFPFAGDSDIDEKQVFLIGVDGPVDTSSLRGNARFIVEGLPERVEADLVQGAELKTLLDALADWSKPPEPRIALRARRAFPNGKTVTLEWGAGILSPGGEKTETSQALRFKTRSPFTIETACRRENAHKGCLPITPVSVQFSAPVAVDKAAALRVVGPDGAPKEPVAFDDDAVAAGFTSIVKFAAPFTEDATYTVTIPDDLRDDAGRALAGDASRSLVVKMGPPTVLAKFAARFGIIERNADPALPVTIRNVESLLNGTQAMPVGAVDKSEFERAFATMQGNDMRISGEDPKEILLWLRRVANAGRAHSLFPAVQPGAAQAGVAPAPEAVVPNAAGVAGQPPIPVAAAAAKAHEPAPFTLPKPLPTRRWKSSAFRSPRPACTLSRSRAPCSARRCSARTRRCTCRRPRW